MKTTLPEISRNLQHDFGGIDPSDSDPSGHLSGSGSSPSSDSDDSTNFSPIKIAEKDLGLLPVRLLPGFAASTKKRKQFLASMSPPRVLFSQFPILALLGNAETEEHEENAQDENEDDGPFASEALSDSEEDKNPEQVPVTGCRFKETLREEKPPRVQVGSSRKRRPGKVDSAEAVEALKLHKKQHAEERAAAERCRWKALNSLKDRAYIQIDGMDQKKTALPHFSKQPKSVDGAALEFRRRIFGQRRPIYSGPRRPPPGSASADRAAHIWELTEIHEKSFLAVLADDETSLWICQVLKINRRNEEGEPTSVHIQWYATEDSNPYTGKFYPEKRRTNGKDTGTCLFRIARDKEASQPEVSNRLSQTIDSANDKETECSGPDLEKEEE
ncbi:hypothetical protein R1sor_016685 [Riccia sorocarpa]|uniref:Uncharacterized protein n=1 Tax=Riccia sorocarpa TaxID=122646 RepID=A0ABD3HHK7_9MARC